MLKYIYYLLPIFFVAQTTSPIIFDAVSYVKELENGSIQTILLLGDCHEYLSEAKPKTRSIIQKNTQQQRNDIINLAKQLNATVLIEDMVYGTPCNTLLGLPTMITLAMDRYLGCYHEQVITNLTTECLEQDIDAYSIECRHADAILETPPPYFVDALRITSSWWPFISTLAVGASCFLNNFLTPLWAQATFTSLKPIIKPPSTTVLGFCMLEAYQWLEITEILNKAKKLHTSPKIQTNIQEIENAWLQNNCYPLDNFVDLKALNYIVEHPECTTIIVCAGAWHTENIADYLEKAGYLAKGMELQFATPNALKINKEQDLIQPLAIAATCRPKSPANVT